MKLEVVGQRFEITGSCVIAEGAVEFATFSLECDESWNSYSKTVRFKHVSQEAVYDVAGVEEGKVYYIPSEVLVRGSVFVSVLGVCGDYCISTTELAGFFVEGSIDSGKTPTVSENAYAQYVKLVKENSSLAKEYADKAEESMMSAEESAINSAQNVETTLEHSQKCEEHVAYCTNAVEQVSVLENSMDSAVQRVEEAVNTLLDRDHSLIVNEEKRIGAENERSTAEEERNTAEGARALAEEERAGAEALRVIAEKNRVLGDNEREERVSNLEQKASDIETALLSKAERIVGSARGRKIVIHDCVEGEPLKFEVLGGYCESGSLNAPRSLIGTNYIYITHNGKNLLSNMMIMAGSFTNDGISYIFRDNGEVVFSGQSPEEGTQMDISFEKVLSAGKYVLSGGNSKCSIVVYNANTYEDIAECGKDETVFELTSMTSVNVRLSIKPGIYIETSTVYPMIRFPFTDAGFEEYKEREYSINFSEPLFAVEGESDKAIITDSTSHTRIEKNLLFYTASGREAVAEEFIGAEYNRFSVELPEKYRAKVYSQGEYAKKGYCSHLSYTDADDMPCCYAENDRLYLTLPAADFPDSASVTALFKSGMPFEVIFVAQSPKISSFTNSYVSLFPDVNYFESSELDMTIEYVKNPSAAIKRLSSLLESLEARVSNLEV